MEQSIYRLLGKGVYPLAAYCSPQCACERGGVRYPSRITQAQYDLLAEAGVNLFYGHSEVAGGARGADVWTALDCAKRAGVGYLARFEEAQEYVSLGTRGYAAYADLTKAQKADLDARFARSLEKYARHPAFYGVSFIDEPGSDMFEGIVAAKKVFGEVCGDKFFYVNLFPYYVTPEQYQYSFVSAQKKCTRQEFSYEHTNLQRYRVYAEKFLDRVRPEVYSYDAYPFVTLGKGAETGIHEVLYDIPGYLAETERKRGIPFWMFMQEGGKWEGDMGVRVPNSSEHRLQYNVALAYGAKGLQLFPCCYPNDWLDDTVCRAGLVDRMGQTTDFYGYFRREARQVRAAGSVLLDAKWEGMMQAGEFNGLLPDEKELSLIRWNECIFRGKLPGGEKYLLSSHGAIERVCATSQVLIGCFKKEGKDLYYVVNNSSVTSANVTVRFANRQAGTFIRNGETEKCDAQEWKLCSLEAGEGVLLLPERKEGE